MNTERCTTCSPSSFFFSFHSIHSFSYSISPTLPLWLKRTTSLPPLHLTYTIERSTMRARCALHFAFGATTANEERTMKPRDLLKAQFSRVDENIFLCTCIRNNSNNNNNNNNWTITTKATHSVHCWYWNNLSIFYFVCQFSQFSFKA